MSTKNVESIDLESPASARRRGGADRQAEEENIVASDIIYDIDTAPPWHLAMVLGFQVRNLRGTIDLCYVEENATFTNLS